MKVMLSNICENVIMLWQIQVSLEVCFRTPSGSFEKVAFE